MATTTQTSSHRIVDIFRYLIRFASLIWVIISSSVVLYTMVSSLLITNDEYIFSQNRELQNCEQPIYSWEKSIDRTPEEKENCKKEATDRVLRTRSYDNKHTIILAWSRLFVCAIVYFIFWNGTRRKND